MNTVPTKPSLDDAVQQEMSCACPPPSNGGNKAKRNFFIDMATAIVLVSMLSTGILLKWVLPPGRFSGRGLNWLGLDRHAWGDVHLWLAFALLALIVTHVALHWSWVKSCWQRCVGNLRSIRTWAVVSVLAVLLFLPLMVPTAQQQPGRGFGRGKGRALQAANGSELVQPRTEGLGRGRGMRGRRGLAAPVAQNPNNVAASEDNEVLDLGTELWEGDFGD